MIDERRGLTSASNFDRRVYCPGSGTLEATVNTPDSKSEVSEFGDEVHHAVAVEDMSELGLTAEKVATRLSSITEQALIEWCKENNFSGASKIIKEERFWIADRNTGVDVCSAKPDFVAAHSQQALIIDLKTGFKAVTPASGNWQLKVQLVALDQFLGPFERARVAIAQHRLGPDKYDACDYTRDDIDQAYFEILFYLRRSNNPDAERVPGAHCRYCRAKAFCAEYAAYGMMPMVRAEMVAPPKKKEIYAKVALLPVKSLAFIESRRSAAENLFDAVKERMKSLPKETLTRDRLRNKTHWFQQVYQGHHRVVGHIGRQQALFRRGVSSTLLGKNRRTGR